MVKQKLLGPFRKFSSGFLAFLLLCGILLGSFAPALAVGQLSARGATLSTSLGGATGVTYKIFFTTASTATIQSFSAQACDTASGSCTQSGAASGFSASSSTLAASQGLSGTWTVNTATTSTLKGTATGATSTNSGTAFTTSSPAMTFGGVANPSASNSTYFLRITTYSDTAYTTVVDQGTVAVSTAGQITVTASVDETLTFTLAAATVALGTLTTGLEHHNTNTMSAATNANSGYVITVNGSTLSGPTTITAMNPATTSSTNTKQFGLNLKANTIDGSFGANPSGGSGAASTGYDTADNFKFLTGDTVASSAGASNTTTYTVSYIANIDGSTPAGSYSTTLTYICTPTF